MNASRSTPYWHRRFQGGLLNGRNRGEPVTRFRRDALLTREDRERWNREEADRLGIPRFVKPLEDRIRAAEEQIEMLRKEPQRRKPGRRGGIPLPEDTL